MWIPSLALTCHHKAILESSNDHINETMMNSILKVVKNTFPNASGLQSTVVVDIMPEPESSDAVQLHYDGMQKHWYTSRQVGSQVQVADSTAPEDSLSEEATAQLHSLYGNVAVEVLPVEHHQNNKDDALLALAFATSFLLNQDPSCLQFYGM